MKLPRALAALLVLVCWARASYGDGGTILLHQDAGAFTITLFAQTQPLRVGTADLSVMVQDKTSGQVLFDPVVDLTSGSETIRLQRGQGGNRLLQAGTVHFSHPGQWRLTLAVRRGNDVAQVSTECTVEPDHSRAFQVWAGVLLPAAIILLFLLHQALKQRNSPSR